MPSRALDLPLDRPRPPIKTYAGAQYDTSLPDELHRQLRKVAASHGCTLYHLLLAAFQALLARLSGQNDMVVGIPVAGQALLPDSNLVGHCVHTLPLRATLDPKRSFDEHLKVTRGLLLSAQEHQGTTFGSLLNRLGIRRDPSRSPLVAVIFNVDRLGPAPIFQGLTAEALPAHKAFVNFELNLNVVDLGAGLRLECSYNTDLFGAATIRRWMDHYRVLLEGVVADPQLPVERLPLLTEEERGSAGGAGGLGAGAGGSVPARAVRGAGRADPGGDRGLLRGRGAELRRAEPAGQRAGPTTHARSASARRRWSACAWSARSTWWSASSAF